MPVTTRIFAFLVGNPYTPSFVPVTWWRVGPMYFLLNKDFLTGGYPDFVISPLTEMCFKWSFLDIRATGLAHIRFLSLSGGMP